MSSLLLQIEITPGASIEEALKDMQTLAKKLDVGVTGDFNGVYLIITSDSNLDRELREFNDHLKAHLSGTKKK